jgi:hypothetical protein
MIKIIGLTISHLVIAALGFAGGIYALPILTAPAAPSTADLQAMARLASYSGEFRRDLEDSDALHWGEGTVYVNDGAISFQGRIAPGPDYRLYLSPGFIQTEAEFIRLKPRLVEVGDVKTFENFVVELPGGIDPGAFTTVIVWCESFGQFITAAQYR